MAVHSAHTLEYQKPFVLNIFLLDRKYTSGRLQPADNTLYRVEKHPATTVWENYYQLSDCVLDNTTTEGHTHPRN